MTSITGMTTTMIVVTGIAGMITTLAMTVPDVMTEETDRRSQSRFREPDEHWEPYDHYDDEKEYWEHRMSQRIPLRGSVGAITTPIMADGRMQSTTAPDPPPYGGVRVQPIVKWKDVPVSVDDDTPWIRRVSLDADTKASGA